MDDASRWIAKEVDSDLLLYDTETDTVHVLNSTAKWIYERAKAGKTLAEIDLELQAAFRYPSDADRLKDLQECIRMLKEKGLLAADFE